MLKTVAFWRMVFLYDTAPAVVNSGKNHTAAGVPLVLGYSKKQPIIVSKSGNARLV
jgi:hypothetical protein